MRLLGCVVLLIATVSGCGGDKGGSTAGTVRPAGSDTPFGPCQQLPAEGDPLPWLPGFLPLPDGTYPVEDLTTSPAFHQALLVTPVPYREFVRFAVQEWPGEGIILGPGEAETGESENTFIKDDEYGQYRVRESFCDTGHSELTLLYATIESGGGTPVTPPPITSLPN